MADESVFTHCIKCSTAKTDGTECPKCGVIYEKAEARHRAEQKRKEAAVVELTAPIEEPEKVASQPEPIKPNNKLINCTACGKAVSKSAEGCPYCGELLSKRETQQPAAQKGRKSIGCGGAIFFILFLLFIAGQFNSPTPPKTSSTSSDKTSEPPLDRQTTKETGVTENPSGYADAVVALINSHFGEYCSARVTGIFTHTLIIDWKPRTTKLQAISVLAGIGKAKERLYTDGVRYFQFPNDAGTYNVVDWKTGEKKSISDRAKYYFDN